MEVEVQQKYEEWLQTQTGTARKLTFYNLHKDLKAVELSVVITGSICYQWGFPVYFH